MEGDGRDESIVCRLFIRNRCFQGAACSYSHPEYNISPDSPTLSWLNFCPDFQRGKCFNQDCRYFHITSDEEDNFKSRQEIAPPLLEQAMRKALLLDVALTGTRATCKKFLQGGCSLPMCPYRHVTREEFINEVLSTLRCEFQIVLGPSDSDFQGVQDFPSRDVSSGNNLSGMNPTMSTMMDSSMLDNRNNLADPIDERQRLERENEEIYRALDPNQKANSLEEIRANMMAIQAALQWKDEKDSNRRGFSEEGLNPGMGNPGMGNPGMGNPGMGNPGMGNPGMGNPGMGNYGRSDSSFAEPSIDLMRRRDAMPQTFERNEGFQMYPGMSRNENNNPPRDRDRRDNFGSQDGGNRRDNFGSQDGKLFVGGLSSVTDTNSLRNYFEQFGDVVDAIVMVKQNKPRGFGFVTYSHPSDAENVLSNGPHRIDGKVVDTKTACANPAESRPRSPKRRERDNRGENRGDNRGDDQGTRLFIGGLKREITTEVLEDYFIRFGKIVDVVSMVDSKTGRPKGYGFVEYQDVDTANSVLESKPHEIFGTVVSVERPNPRDRKRSNPPPRERDNRSRNNGKSSPRLFIGGLSEDMTTDDLNDYFSRFGNVVDCILITEPRTGRRRGFGFVEFESEEVAEKVLAEGPHKIYGVRLSVEIPSPRMNSRDK